jgi:tetratricopeptide (TPR) repeat protein
MRKRSVADRILDRKADMYTGRQAEIDVFFDCLHMKESDEYKVLSYYGVGGIGKTELRKELMKRIKNNSTVDFAYLNFETKEYQQVEKALVHLRTVIGAEYRVPFTLFDAAYIIYMKKTNSKISLNQTTLPFIEEGSWLADAVSISEELPYLALVPKLIEMISNRLKNTFSKEDKEKIQAFERLEEHELLELLPVIFAEDLDKYIVKSRRYFVLFIDTYEALWTDQRMKAYEFGVDEWVRELVAQLPNVLWVIFGREPIDWGRYLEEWDACVTKVELGSLSEEETKLLLSRHQVREPDIQEEIYRNSKGHPYSIKLANDLYKEILTTRQPAAADFIWQKTPYKLFERFIKYLLVKEKQALELLALTNNWNINTYQALMSHFDIRMNSDDHLNLSRFSFITEADDGHWEMHQLMRESLIDYQPAEKVIDGRFFLYDYFKRKLSKELVKNDPHQASTIINQAFYHGFLLMEKERLSLSEFIDWFRDYDGVYYQIKQNYLTLPLLTMLKNHLEGNVQTEAGRYLGIILYDIAFIYMMENRDYEKAELFFKEALELREQKFPDDHLAIAKSYYGLASLYHQAGRKDEAKELHLKAFHLREQYCDSSNRLALAFSTNGLARLYQDLGDYDQAQYYYGYSLNVYETLERSDNVNLSITMMNLISCYHELLEYEKAYEYAEKVRDLIENDVHFNQIIYAKALNSLGVMKTAIEQHEEALELLQRALGIFKERLGDECIEVSKVLHNLALTHALLNSEESLVLLNKCIELKKRLVSVNKLSEGNLNYRYTIEMEQILTENRFEYHQLKFNF